MDKAGSYAIQGDYFNVVGLPLSQVSDQLRDYGIEVI
jgi:predicted house-cleaning NTP pyrophosphatase (Maf/HAM1 superfamily)